MGEYIMQEKISEAFRKEYRINVGLMNGISDIQKLDKELDKKFSDDVVLYAPVEKDPNVVDILVREQSLVGAVVDEIRKYPIDSITIGTSIVVSEFEIY